MAHHFFSLDDSFPVIPGSDLLFSPAALPSHLPPTPIEAHNTAARKRQREEEEEKAAIKASIELADELSSDNPDDIVDALNYLLLKSADHDLNYALGRDGEKVIDALVLLFDETIGWVHGNKQWVLKKSDGENDEDWSLTPSSKTWECHAKPCINPSGSLEKLEWQSFCATRFAPASLNTGTAPSHVPSYNMQNIENDREGIKMLEIIIMIVRNLSYVQGNVRFILHSLSMLRILTGSLYFRNFYTGKEFRGAKNERDDSDFTLGNSSNNICLHAINAFHNMASFFDITGRKIFLDLYLLDGDIDVDTSQTKAAKYAESVDIKSFVKAELYGRIQGMGWAGLHVAKSFNAKDDTLSKLPEGLFRPAVKNYVRASLALFPTLFGLMRVRASRAVVVQGLEMIILLVDNPDNRDVFLHTPDDIISQLVHLLYLPRLGPDSLEYMDPIINSVSRVSAMKLLGGYDMSVDYEIRDRSVEILQKITSMSDDLKIRAGRKIVLSQTDSCTVDVAKTSNLPCTRLYDAIIPMLTTRAGREHTPLFAAKLLAQLASVEENRIGIMYSERKVVFALTSANKEVSQILVKEVLRKLYDQ